MPTSFMVKTIPVGRLVAGRAFRAPITSRVRGIATFSRTTSQAQGLSFKQVGPFLAKEGSVLHQLRHRSFGTMTPLRQSRPATSPEAIASEAGSAPQKEDPSPQGSAETGFDPTIKFESLSLRQLGVLLALFGLFFTGTAVQSRISNEKLQKLLLERPPAILDSMLAHLRKALDRLDGSLAASQVAEQIIAMRNARKYKLASEFGVAYKSLMNAVKDASKDVQQTCSQYFLQAEDWYLKLPAAKAAVLPVAVINTTVFLAWKLPPLRTLMKKHFVDVAGKSKVHTMITATFSHQSLLHLAVNQMALWSFCAFAMDPIGGPRRREDALVERTTFRSGFVATSPPEADLAPQYFGFFLCAGIAASLASRARFTLRFHQLRQAAQSLNEAGTSWSTINASLRAMTKSGSLGASGSLYGIVTLTALVHPDTPIGIPFVPGYSVNIQNGLLGMICIDVLGIITGLGFLDHAAHLGGALFGFWWYHQGQKWWIWCRANVFKSKESTPAPLVEPAKAPAKAAPLMRTRTV